MARVPVGGNIVRTIVGWNITGTLRAWSWELLIGQPIFMGVQTWASGRVGSPAPPDTASLTDVAPPTERWLFWEASCLVTYRTTDQQYHNESVVYGSSTGMETRETQGQALNDLVGQTLDVYVSVGCPSLAALGLEFTGTSYVTVIYQT